MTSRHALAETLFEWAIKKYQAYPPVPRPAQKLAVMCRQAPSRLGVTHQAPEKSPPLM